MPFIIEKERDPLYQDGLEKGREEGLKRAEEKTKKTAKKTKIAIAEALLKQGVTIEVIVKSIGLSKKEIEKNICLDK